MARTKIPFIILVAFVAVSLILVFPPSTLDTGIEKEGSVLFQGSSGAATLDVEIADTPQEHRTGLMYRRHLDDNEGMLFVFTGDAPRSFWMKDTFIPLDMIFVNSSMDIVKIHEDVQPCVTATCRSYGSGAPAKYVIEANSGFSEKNGIEAGQRITILA
jgi:uncharacterized membrane protein (UPF0127 family)